MAKLHTSRICLRSFAICFFAACAFAANSQTARETGNQQDSVGLPSITNPPTKPPLARLSSANRDGVLRIDVVVTDAAGKPVTDLDAKDFTLLDDGLPTHILTLQSSTRQDGNSESLPELIFVFNEDTLPSGQSQRAEKVVAAYLRKSGGQLSQSVSLYRVTHDGLFASARRSIDGNALSEEAEMRREPRLLWPAGAKSPGRYPMDHADPQIFRSNGVLGLIATDQRNIPGPKTLIWFGDSWLVAGHWCNLNEAVELSTRLREARIAVNLVLLNPRLEGNTDVRDLTAAAEKDKPLQPARFPLSAVATHTGGLVVDAWDDLMNGIERCAAEAGSFYSLTFDPPRTEHSDEYHDLAVAVSRPGLTARTFAGYYNQPEYWDHPRPDLERVNVAQLEEAIRGKAGDSGFPRRLGNMELTERLMNKKRTQLLGLLRDDREREALIAVADLSEFLAPPAGDALPDPFPGRAAETEILKRTYDYLSDSIHKLPDFFATRTTVSYQEPQVRDEDSCKIRSTEQPLRVTFTARGTVLYRNGAEVVDVEKSRRKRMLKGRENALDTQGTFGPVLASVLAAAATGQSTPPGAAGRRAARATWRCSDSLFRPPRLSLRSRTAAFRRETAPRFIGI